MEQTIFRQWNGDAPITEPGVYQNMPLTVYHEGVTEGHSVSHSGIERLFAHSPAAYWDKCYANPDRDADAPTEAMVLGRAAHHWFLGERSFQMHFIRRPDKAPDGRAWNGNNLSCIDWLEKAEKRGLTVITPTQVEALARMHVALSAHPMIQAGILNGRVEHSFVWRDRTTGLWLKARPDVNPNDTGDFADLKVVSDISEDGLQSIIARFGYHRQASLVLEGAHYLLGLPLDFRGPGGDKGMSFTLVFVESKRPHCVEIVTLKPSDIEAGMYENRLAIRLLARCLKEDDWPGPSGYQGDARYLGLRDFHSGHNTLRAAHIKAMLDVMLPQRTEND